MSTPVIAICRCSQHGFYAVTLDVAGGGTRVTPSKCCGRWDTIQSWPLTARAWRALAEEAEAMASIVDDAASNGEDRLR